MGRTIVYHEGKRHALAASIKEGEGPAQAISIIPLEENTVRLTDFERPYPKMEPLSKEYCEQHGLDYGQVAGENPMMIP